MMRKGVLFQCGSQAETGSFHILSAKRTLVDSGLVPQLAAPSNGFGEKQMRSADAFLLSPKDSAEAVSRVN